MSIAPPDDQDDRSPSAKSRLDRELEEILARSRADDLPTESRRPRPIPFPQRTTALPRPWNGLLAPHRRGALMIVIALVLALCAVLVSDASPLAANILVIAAVVAFAWPIVQRMRGPSRSGASSMPPPSRTWRGQEIDIRPGASSPADSLRDWWNRRQRR